MRGLAPPGTGDAPRRGASGHRGEAPTSRNEAVTDPYTTVDVQGGYEVVPGVLVRAGVNNLFDELYVHHLNARNPFTGQRIPEPGRVVLVRLSYAF